MRRRLTLAALLVMGGMLSACATGQTPGAAPAAIPEPTETIVDPNGYGGTAPGGPGAYLVRYGTTELQVDPVTYCWGNGCVDGVDPDPTSVGSPDEIFVFVPVDEFDRLYVSQRSDDDWCDARYVDSAVTDLGGGWWRVEPRGPADDYIVDLFASGDGAGDMAASIRWATPTDQALPEPTASLALIADHDGVPDSYGLELAVGNLAASPTDARATITVTAANGESMTLEATSSPDACPGVGALYFDGPDDEALAASKLGDFPFTYDVELVLDGTSYTATATFPDDLVEEHGVDVALEFEPALP